MQALAGHIPFFGGPHYEMAKRVHFVGVKLMRVTLAAIVATILLTAFAQAQQWLPAQRNGAGSGLPYAESRTQTFRTKQRPPAENEYKAAVKGIPDRKEAFDPWRNAR